MTFLTLLTVFGNAILNSNSLVLWSNEILHVKCAVKWKKEVDNA